MKYGLKQATIGTLALTLVIATANTQAATLRVPSDSLYKQQSYLKQIGMEQAWTTQQENTKMIIAVVDTGVDLNHPDLQDNLVEGYNVLDPGEAPEDNNGHGTNVAGIIAAQGNNKVGTAGVLWRAKIMPIKALDSSGRGDELHLAEGIRYAVDHKAKIIVLSLGVFNYSTLLKEAIAYAETKNVLVVAAAGNEGAEVKYPAAFPTVLSVGGVDANNKANSRSNRGSELSLVAPWSVFTTMTGGSYMSNQGTSMAAPQIAGVAALVWAKQPSLSAYEVRAILTQTAQDLGTKGWDSSTGFGLIRADKALSLKKPSDMFEPNNRISQAATLPLERQIYATLADADDSDNYRITLPYHGNVLLDLQTEATRSSFKLDLYDNKSRKVTSNTFKTSPIKLNLEAGTYTLRITTAKSLKADAGYRLTAGFQIANDSYESNDKQATAFDLNIRSQTVTGTFSKVNDYDWYALKLDNDTEFECIAKTDTRRIDLELLVTEQFGFPTVIDSNFEGGTETVDKISGKAGETYFIRVRNVNDSDNVNPVAGQYILTFTVSEHLNDWNESNDFSYRATPLPINKTIEGTFATPGDQDWFKINITQPSYLNLSLANLPKGVSYNATLMNNLRTVIQNKAMNEATDKVSYDNLLEPGTYYLKLTTSRAYDAKYYGIKITLDPLISGYRDIANHWSKSAVIKLVHADILSPDTTARFRPDDFISREEAADMVHAILGGSKQGIISVSEKNAKAALSRAQAAEIACKMLKSDGKFGITKPFDDISYTYWAVRYIREMKDKKFMTAVKEDSFFPEKSMSRADFAGLMAKVLDEK